jgi:hypothetical protein
LPPANHGEDFVRLGMPPRLLLREDEPAVDDDLEHPSDSRMNRELGDRMLELLEEPGRQTDGPGTVASAAAVLDRDLHGHEPNGAEWVGGAV